MHNTKAKQILYGGAAGGGKVIAYSDNVLTPFGFKANKDLQIGDIINKPEGGTCRIIQLHPWQTLPTTRVTFSDHTSLDVHMDHLWYAWRASKSRKLQGSRVFGEASAEIVETREIKSWLDKRHNVLIPLCKPQEFTTPSKYGVLIDPYILGVLLGDGILSAQGIVLSTGERDKPFMREQLNGYEISEWKGAFRFCLDSGKKLIKDLTTYKLLGAKSDTKFIPNAYKLGNLDTRKQLLAGLMDTDGTVNKRGHLSYTTVSKQLAEDVAFVVRSLGGMATITTRTPFYRKNDEKIYGKLAYTLYIKLPFNPCRMPRKSERFSIQQHYYRRIIHVEETGESFVGRCITVSNPSGLYITNDFIVTHNSKSIRQDAIRFAMENPGFQGYLFRKSRMELQNTHIRAIQLELPPHLGIGEYSEKRNAFEFKNTSIINFCYAEDLKDVRRYLSEEMHWLGIDEASTFLPDALGFLISRVRLGGWTPKVDKDRLPRIIYATNPGGPSHNYLKAKFITRFHDDGITPVQPEEIFYDDELKDPFDPNDKGMTSIYIPAKTSDNKYLDKNYAAMFSMLPPELAKAYRQGDWDIVLGRAIHNLDRNRHMIPPFVPPSHWTIFSSLDWGMASPFSWGLYCVSEGLVHPNGTYLPPGALIRFKEWYGWTGKPNQGLGMAPQDVARGCKEREEKFNLTYRIADNEIFAKKGGPSIAEWIQEAVPGMTFNPSVKDRKQNYNEVIARLAGNPYYFASGEKQGLVEQHPQLFVTADCIHFWRTVPTLELDETDPEKGPATKNVEDHIYDEVAYACRSRPFITSLQHLEELELKKWRREAEIKPSAIPFSTVRLG
jgi:hypothetical protein